MKKLSIVLLTAIVGFSLLSYAAAKKIGMFAGSQVSATVVRNILPVSEGQTVISSLSYSHKSSATSATASASFKFYRPDITSVLNSNVVSGTNLYITTQTAGVVDGHTVSVNDFVVLFGTNNTRWQIAGIGQLVTNSASQMTLKLVNGSAFQAAADAKVYIAKAANIVTLPLALAASEQAPVAGSLTYPAASFDKMPMAVELIAMTNATFGGTYELWW